MNAKVALTVVARIRIVSTQLADIIVIVLKDTSLFKMGRVCLIKGRMFVVGVFQIFMYI